MSIKREYDFDQVGQKDMYLLHHEEIESLAKEHPGGEKNPFLHDIRTELSGSYEMSGRCGNAVYNTHRFSGAGDRSDSVLEGTASGSCKPSAPARKARPTFGW